MSSILLKDATVWGLSCGCDTVEIMMDCPRIGCDWSTSARESPIQLEVFLDEIDHHVQESHS